MQTNKDMYSSATMIYCSLISIRHMLSIFPVNSIHTINLREPLGGQTATIYCHYIMFIVMHVG